MTFKLYGTHLQNWVKKNLNTSLFCLTLLHIIAWRSFGTVGNEYFLLLVMVATEPQAFCTIIPCGSMEYLLCFAKNCVLRLWHIVVSFTVTIKNNIFVHDNAI